MNYYFSEKYLTYLYYSLPFAKEIDEKQLGISIRNTLLAYEASSKQTNKSSLNILDEIDTGELLRMSANSTKVLYHLYILIISYHSLIQLTERIPECHLAYLDNKDGAIALNILTGPREKSVITLGDLLKPLDKGNPGLCLPLEPRICNDYLTTYTDPGPFASFAPQFGAFLTYKTEVIVRIKLFRTCDMGVLEKKNNNLKN